MSQRLETYSTAESLEAVASRWLGGPLGRRAASGLRIAGFAVPVSCWLLLVATVTMTATTLVYDYCRMTAWGNDAKWVHMCYSDVPALIGAEVFSGKQLPIIGTQTHPVEQTLGAATIMWLIAQVAPAGELRGVWAFDIATVATFVGVLLVTLSIAALLGRRPQRAMLYAASPVLVTSALVSVDLCGVAVVLLGMWAVRRRAWWLGGVLMALGMTVVPQLWVVPLALVVLGTRRGGPVQAQLSGLVALAGFACIGLAHRLLSPQGFVQAWLWLKPAVPGYGSLWRLATLNGGTLDKNTLWIGWITVTCIGLGAVCGWALRTATAPRWPVLALMLGVVVVLGAPANSVQSAVWLLPLAVLALPRAVVLLPWFAVEVWFALMTWMFIYRGVNAAHGAPDWLYATAVIVRLMALAWMAAECWQISRAPEYDSQRTSDVDGIGGDPSLPPALEVPDQSAARASFASA